MKSHPIRQHVAISMAIIMMASLACKVGWRPIDQFHAPAPGDMEEMRQQAVEDEMEREQRELELKGLPSEGGFVPPVAPQTQPAASPAAPQANAPVGGPAPGAPVITDIDFPSTIPANGATYDGWVSFTDADGDVSGLRMHVLHSTTPMSDWEGRPKTLEGTTFAGRYRIGFYCTIPSLHSMQITIFDAAGNTGNSMDFSWECQ